MRKLQFVEARVHQIQSLYGTNLKFDGYARVTISYLPQRLQNIASRLQKLMTEDLISMHMELRESYGLEKSGCSQLMRWDCDDEYSLLVNLKSLLDFCFLTCICMFAGYTIMNSGSVLEQSISSFISKRSALFELHESLLTTKSPECLRASQLVCFVIFSEQWWLFRKATFAATELEALGYSPDESILHKQISIESLLNDLAVTSKNFRTIDDERSALFELLESLLTTKSTEGLRASQLVCMWWLFRKATFASTKLETLGYSPDESILQKFWKLCERQLNIPGIFKHGEMEALISCEKALKFYATESYGELQDFALKKLKGIGDELIIILKSAIKEVVACALNKLKLSRQISIESLLNDIAVTSKNFRTIDDEVGIM
ncbi:hypothetical protein KY290_007926 [Solanum tuberosum]|uniref:Uncharacterized protein n=1 Tax=Solanum tuberosum TaxID=4113 RepID=A0ABQ7W6Z3_SOLTU|nr:hypothetical protein KY290_007926 [Solanum tuberosum]